MIETLRPEELEYCTKNNVQIVTPKDLNYPNALRAHTFRPHVLFYWGQAIWNEKICLSVVGSRNPSGASLDWMDLELGAFMKTHDVAIISGGARGVDQRAHQLALRAGRPTVAFVPSGLMRLYPNSLIDWIKPIIDSGGAVISQFAPSATMCKGFFHARNRLIAAISPSTLVIEARRQSGTMLTARQARDMGREVAAVPSSPTEAGLGGLDLIVEGATVIRDAIDLSIFARAPILVNTEDQKYQICHPSANRRGDLSGTN